MLALTILAVVGAISFGILAHDAKKTVVSIVSVLGSIVFFLLAVLLFQGVDFVVSLGLKHAPAEVPDQTPPTIGGTTGKNP